MDHNFIYENGGRTLHIEDSTVERVDPFSWDLYKDSLIEINARGSLLKELPALPQLHRSPYARPTRDKKGKLVYKWYDSNQKYDGDLMFCVRKIDVSDTPIEKLPSLPLGLEELYLNNCKNLTSLPALPKTLKLLSMSGTNIEKIPPLPEGLTHLNVGGCPLKMLPFLPKSLERLRVEKCKKLILPRKALEIKHRTIQEFHVDENTNIHQQIMNNQRFYVEKVWQPIEDYIEKSNALWYTINHTRRMKQSLVAKAFHPSRVEKWLEVGGFELLEMLF